MKDVVVMKLMMMMAFLSHSPPQSGGRCNTMALAWCHRCYGSSQRTTRSLRYHSNVATSSTPLSLRRKRQRQQLPSTFTFPLPWGRRTTTTTSNTATHTFMTADAVVDHVASDENTGILKFDLNDDDKQKSRIWEESYNTALQKDDDDDDDSVISKLTIEKKQEGMEIADDDDWRQRPEVNPSFSFPTWLIPKAYSQRILKMKEAQPHLASRMDIYQDMHPRLPVIRKYNDTHNLILLQCHTHYDDDNEEQQQQQQHALVQMQKQDIPITVGPVLNITIPYSQWSVSFLLSQLLPKSVHPIPTAFETVGHIAHFNLKQHHMPYGKLIGQVVLQCLSPTISMVITKDGTVQGPHRTYAIQVLASAAPTASSTNPTTTTTDHIIDNHNNNPTATTNTINDSNHTTTTDAMTDTRVTVQESGLSLTLDLATCYWNSRLWQERQDLLVKFIRDDQWIVDAFCGVGALSLLIAKQHPSCRLWCNDWNPHAVQFLKENAKRNQVELERIDQMDTFDLMVDIGLQATAQMMNTASMKKANKKKNNDVDDEDSDKDHVNQQDNSNHDEQKVQQQPKRFLPHHVIMHYPLEAPRFLSALRWWPANCPDVMTAAKTMIKRRKPKTSIMISKEQQQQQQQDTQQPSTLPHDLPRFHVYTFCRLPLSSSSSSSEPLNNNDGKNNNVSNNDVSLTEEDVAIDIIANELLPCAGATEPRTMRRSELEQLGCALEVRRIRDVAPGKFVMCVSFSVTSHLLRHMQGDYI